MFDVDSERAGSKRADGASPSRPHGLEDGVGIGELPRLQLGIDLLAIDADLKAAAARRHQREAADFLFELQEFVRQTDGTRLVVSDRAILDDDFQGHNLRCSAMLGDRKWGVKAGGIRSRDFGR